MVSVKAEQAHLKRFMQYVHRHANADVSLLVSAVSDYNTKSISQG